MHPHEVVALLQEFLMQVRQHGGDLVAEDIEPDVLVGIEQGFARDVGERRLAGEPVMAAAVGQVEMQPQPAALIGQLRIEIGDVDLGRRSRRRQSDRPR